MDAGFAISLTGTLLSAAGFLFTFWQLKKTSNATEAAKNAIESLRNRITTFDYATECAKCRKSLEHSIGLIKLKQWPDIANSLVEAQISLHRISISPQCTEENKKPFQTTSENMIDAISDIEDFSGKNQDIDLAAFVKSMRKVINLLDTELNSKSQEV